jgi:hypothetical protein
MSSNVPTQQQMAAFLAMRQARDKVAKDLWAEHVARVTPPARIAQNVQSPQSVASAGPDWTAYVPVSDPSLTSYAPRPLLAAGYASVADFKPVAPAAAVELAGEEGKDDDCSQEYTELRLETDATSRKYKLLHIRKEVQLKEMERDITALIVEKDMYKSRYEELLGYVTAKKAELDAQQKDLRVDVDEYVKASGGKDGEAIALLTKTHDAFPVLTIPGEARV